MKKGLTRGATITPGGNSGWLSFSNDEFITGIAIHQDGQDWYIEVSDNTRNVPCFNYSNTSQYQGFDFYTSSGRDGFYIKGHGTHFPRLRIFNTSVTKVVTYIIFYNKDLGSRAYPAH